MPMFLEAFFLYPVTTITKRFVRFFSLELFAFSIKSLFAKFRWDFVNIISGEKISLRFFFCDEKLKPLPRYFPFVRNSDLLNHGESGHEVADE